MQSRRWCPILTSFALSELKKEIVKTDAFLPHSFHQTFRCALLNKQRFAAAIMRIRNPKTTALIFASGKMVCTGAKTEALAREAALRMSEFNSQAVANSAWAFATVNYRD